MECDAITNNNKKVHSIEIGWTICANFYQMFEKNNMPIWIHIYYVSIELTPCQTNQQVYSQLNHFWLLIGAYAFGLVIIFVSAGTSTSQ